MGLIVHKKNQKKISTAGYTHMAIKRRARISGLDNEFMAFWFAADGFINDRVQKLISFTRPQRCTEVCVILLP